MVTINGKSDSITHFRLNDTSWDDLRVPLTSINRAGSNAPDFAVFKTNGAGSQGVFVDWFDKTTEEEVYFSVQLPHSWAGTDLEPHVHWVPASNGAENAVVNWGLEYTWASVGSVFGNTTIISGNTHTPVAASLVAGTHYITPLGTIARSDETFSSMLLCRAFRDAAGALGTDDYDYDAGLLEIDFHFEISKFGTDQEYSDVTP